MKINKNEEKFLLEVKHEVNNLIDVLCEKYNFDRAYFNFILKCVLLNEAFQKYDEIVLFDDTDYGFCIFCGKKTYFVEDENFYCAECYGKLKQGGK